MGPGGVGVPPDWLTPRWLLRIATSGFVLPGEPAGPFAAPGGSDEPAFPGGRIDRLRREVAWFPVTTHRCPIPGLAEPVRMLVQSAQPSNIELVMVDGRILKRGAQFTTIDMPKVVADANIPKQD